MQSGRQKFWSIGGSKGGVGTSALTASMAAALARMGRSVVAVDAGPGTPNLHAYLGIKIPAHTFPDFLENRATAEDVLLPTPVPGLGMISCAREMLAMTDPMCSQKDRIIKFITALNAEYILVDLGAGTSSQQLDFFNMSEEGIVVVSPDLDSPYNAYKFIESGVFRKIQHQFAATEAISMALKDFRTFEESGSRTMMDFYELACNRNPDVGEKVVDLVDSYRPQLLVNMATSERDLHVAEMIQSTSKKILNIEINLCGLVVSHPAVREAGKRMTPLDVHDPNCAPAIQVRNIVRRLLNRLMAEETQQASISSNSLLTQPITGFNDNLEFMGRELHIQTEDLGHSRRCITTQVFCNGKIILSTKSEYPSSIGNEIDRSQVMELMRQQHFSVIRKIAEKKGG